MTSTAAVALATVDTQSLVNSSSFFKWFNSYSGFINLIGLWLVVPLAIISDRLITKNRKLEYRKNIMLMIEKEFYLNIKCVGDILDSHEKQLGDTENLRIPKFPPRINVLEKFIRIEDLGPVGSREIELLLEVYENLLELRREFFWFRDFRYKNVGKMDLEIYKTLSSGLIEYCEVTMNNMIDLWINVLSKSDSEKYFEIETVSALILSKIKNRKWIYPSYLASGWNESKTPGKKVDIILCWKKDTEVEGKEIIVLKDLMGRKRLE
jgi:hypothetical protein